MLINAFSKLQASTLALETTHSTVSTIPKRLQITQQVLGKRITNTFWTCTCTFIYLPSIELAPTRIPSLTPYRWRTCRWSWTSRTTRTTPLKSSASLMSTTSSTRRSRRLTCSSWGDRLFQNIFLTIKQDLFSTRPSQEGEAAFEELERTFASLDFEEIFQKMEITNAGLELPKMKLDFSANLKPALRDIGELEQRMIF